MNAYKLHKILVKNAGHGLSSCVRVHTEAVQSYGGGREKKL